MQNFKQDLFTYRIAHLTMPCPSNKKYCHTNLKCDANAHIDVHAAVRQNIERQKIEATLNRYVKT